MTQRHQTPRQHIIHVLEGKWLSAYDLASALSISERQVEEHLEHIVKTLKRDPSKQFSCDPAACRECNFVFDTRTRFTRPSRCPRCKAENVMPPRFGITSIEYT